MRTPSRFPSGAVGRRCAECYAPTIWVPRLFAAVVLEGELHLGAVGDDRAFFELHVELDDLGDAEVTQAGGGHLDGGRGCCFPGLAARADEFDDLVNALGHWGLLLGYDSITARIVPHSLLLDCTG